MYYPPEKTFQNIILGDTKKTLILVYEKIVIMDGVENKNALSELI